MHCRLRMRMPAWYTRHTALLCPTPLPAACGISRSCFHISGPAAVAVDAAAAPRVGALGVASDTEAIHPAKQSGGGLLEAVATAYSCRSLQHPLKDPCYSGDSASCCSSGAMVASVVPTPLLRAPLLLLLLLLCLLFLRLYYYPRCCSLNVGLSPLLPLLRCAYSTAAVLLQCDRVLCPYSTCSK